jgi:hypothetical protein
MGRTRRLGGCLGAAASLACECRADGRVYHALTAPRAVPERVTLPEDEAATLSQVADRIEVALHSRHP